MQNEIVPAAGAGQATKERIRAAAAAMFVRDGFDGMTMRGIAREVGVSATALYRHYANREAIVEDIWRLGCEDLARSMIQPIETDDTTGRVLTLVRRYVTWALAQPEIFELMYRDNAYGLNTLPRRVAHDVSDVANTSIFVLVREIKRAIERGEWRPDNVWQIAVTIWSQSRGLLSLHWAGLIDLPQESLPEVACISVGYLIRGFEVGEYPSRPA